MTAPIFILTYFENVENVVPYHLLHIFLTKMLPIKFDENYYKKMIGVESTNLAFAFMHKFLKNI